MGRSLHEYQKFGVDWILKNSKCGVFMEMGLGKTAVALTACENLIYQECEVSKVLVIATKRIVRGVWKQEAQKWDHLKHVKFSIVWGTKKERIDALNADADIYLINRENVQWLILHYMSAFPFKMIIIDESSSFKSHASLRFKHLCMVLNNITRLVLLTGTPTPNGYMDLWAQIYLLDKGQRLEKNISQYRERYFTLKNPGDLFSGYRLRKGSEESITEKISDICMSMKASDYIDLPDLIENDIVVMMDGKIKELYDKFEEECVMSIKDKDITAINAAALNQKLMQFSNGAVYFNDINLPNKNNREYANLHDAKLDALEEIIDESGGKPIFVAYNFKHDLNRIKHRFPYARTLDSPKDEEDWNKGKISLLLAHPASAGHGLNLQFGGHIVVWFCLTWNLEHYLQFNARILRQGQTNPFVVVHRLISDGTIDEKAASALKKKGDTQAALMDALAVIKSKYV